MALRALPLRHAFRWLKPFSTSLSRGFANALNASSSSVAARTSSSSNPFGGFGRPWPLSRHLTARWRSWETLADCKHWLIVLDFPKDPKPTREEMIDTYVKTLANVLGSFEEAKKKIYALSTTVYTGFQCNIDEATSEKLKDQPLVSWVLPDGYGDPENGIFAGDRYDNGVITPDPRPPRPAYERSRNYDRPRYNRDGRQRDFRSMEGRDNMQGDRRDFRPREGGTTLQGARQDYRPRERRDNWQGERQDYRPMTGRDNMQGERQDYRPMTGRDNVQGERQDYRPMTGRDNVQGDWHDNRQMEGRDNMQGQQQGYESPLERRNPMQGDQRG